MNIWIPKCLSEVKGLPDEFKYNYYLELSNCTDLGRWAFEFAKRQENAVIKDITLTENASNGGHVYYTPKAGDKFANDTYDNKYEEGSFHWENGVYKRNGHSHLSASRYIDTYISNSLRGVHSKFVCDRERTLRAGAYMISDEEKAEIAKAKKTHPVITKTYNPKGTGTTLFKNDELKQQHLDFIKTAGKTATFLVNLEMPTSRLLSELERVITHLKVKRKIEEINFEDNKNIYSSWAISLGSYDLKKMGVKPEIIKKKNIHFCCNGSQLKMKREAGFDNVKDIIKDADNTMYKRRIKMAEKLINGGWKQLIGHPF